MISIRGLEIHKESKNVILDGEEIKLTPTEYRILILFAENQGRVFSIGDIYERVWKEQFYNSFICEYFRFQYKG